jgi:chromosomal replication initiation ATPase DnaA
MSKPERPNERPLQLNQEADPWCPVCKGTKWLRQDLPIGHPDFGKRIACVCLLNIRRERQRQELLALSPLSEIERQHTLHSFYPQVKGVQLAYQAAQAIIAALEDWAQKGWEERYIRNAKAHSSPPEEWIVFVGPVGVGKTHLALAITNACIDAGIVTLFSLVPDLLDHLRATFAPGSTIAYDELFERLQSAELLVLDDLGTQRSSPWADEKLFQLLNHRYVKRLPTVVTMNQKAWSYLDERLRSRLSDTSLVRQVSLEEAKDYRMRRSQNTRTIVEVAPREKEDSRE